eukprot:TRINITY_DN123322_c0_g1_i1.p1 TRINITY_DN123322_c0_g1~~TRINITY_DN123322_c0_g1_i1.p1  ORF type:complete len:556 (+),score=125.76 TRINITY_DN123322_c0_g1_i1:105-1772(+)
MGCTCSSQTAATKTPGKPQQHQEGATAEALRDVAKSAAPSESAACTAAGHSPATSSTAPAPKSGSSPSLVTSAGVDSSPQPLGGHGAQQGLQMESPASAQSNGLDYSPMGHSYEDDGAAPWPSALPLPMPEPTEEVEEDDEANTAPTGNVEPAFKHLPAYLGQNESNKGKIVGSDEDDAPSNTIEPSAGNENEDDELARIAARMAKKTFITDSRGKVEEAYSLGEQIGAGEFGCVRRGASITEGVLRAVKTISKSKKIDLHRGSGCIKREIEINRNLEHPNVVRMFDVFEDRWNVHLVFELCSGRTLGEWMNERGKFAEAQVAFLSRQLFCALGFVHSKGICHRDIKPENMLFASSDAVSAAFQNLPVAWESAQSAGVLKLSDFGLSCEVAPGQELESRVGTANYVAPQVIMACYDVQCDVWSAGVSVYSFHCCNLPFTGNTLRELERCVMLGNFSFPSSLGWDDVSEEAKAFVRALLKFDASERYTALQALQDPWLTRQGLQTAAPPAGGFSNEGAPMSFAFNVQEPQWSGMWSPEEGESPGRSPQKLPPVSWV